jgi:hypothetical protein
MELREAIVDLQGLGHSERAIAQAVAAESGQTCTQATINRIKKGVIADPAFSLGAALLRVHHRLTKKRRRAA